MKKQLIADFSLLLVALIWGATFVIVQSAISLLPPFSFNGVRFLIAALLLGLWLIIFERKQLALLNRKLVFSGIFIGIWLFVGYASQTVGLLYTSSSKAAFITGLSVVMVPLFSLFLLKLRPTKNAVIGVIIATIGLYLLTMTDISSLNKGDALTFICAIGFALHIISVGKFSGKYPTLLLTVIQISTVSLLSIVFSLFLEDWGHTINTGVLFNKEVMIALFITSFFATALAYLAQTNFQKFTTPTRVALIYSMEPVFAAVTAYIWAHERLSFSALIGCFFILGGMVIAELPTKHLIRMGKIKKEEAL